MRFEKKENKAMLEKSVYKKPVSATVRNAGATSTVIERPDDVDELPVANAANSDIDGLISLSMVATIISAASIRPSISLALPLMFPLRRMDSPSVASVVCRSAIACRCLPALAPSFGMVMPRSTV